LQQQLQAGEAELAGVEADAKRYSVTAPFAGTLRDIDPDLRKGNWLSQSEPLARLVDDKSVQVVTFLSEDEVALVAPDDTARFYVEGLDGPVLRLEVLRIDPEASASLAEGELAMPYGGGIAVRERKGVLYPEQAIYRVILKVQDPLGTLDGHSWRGKVVIGGSWSAPGLRFMRSALSLFWREAGF
jgi:putative peptide zinc metalloprotease protein